ncbi:hypothetical protein P4E94_05640 [Pontiellaceae bacterium B12219]|nr:hypothetical protein [Pontiellaceae bacterium B12219]
MKTYSIIWGLLFIGTILLVVASELVSPGMHATMMSEGGWVETASWVSYFVAAFFVALQVRRWPVRWSMLVLTLVLGMRELDFDKRFTTMGIFKSRFYSSSDVPIPEKIIALIISACIVAALFFLIKNHLKPFIERLKRFEGPSLCFLFSGGLLVFAKSIDGLSRKLEPFGIVPSDATNRIAGSVEESFELAAALLIVAAAVGALNNYRSK